MCINRWINKVWYIHIMEYCSVTINNELLIATWMNLKIIIKEARPKKKIAPIGRFHLHKIQ